MKLVESVRCTRHNLYMRVLMTDGENFIKNKQLKNTTKAKTLKSIRRVFCECCVLAREKKAVTAVY